MPRSLDPENYPFEYVGMVREVSAGGTMQMSFPDLPAARRWRANYTSGFVNALTQMQRRIALRGHKDTTEEEKGWMDVLKAARAVDMVGPYAKDGTWHIDLRPKSEGEFAQAVKRARRLSSPAATPAHTAKHQAPPKPKSDFQAMLDRLLDVQREVDEAGKINPPEGTK